MNVAARAQPKEIETVITVTRADGTVQEYGPVANSSWGFRQRLAAARRTASLNRQARAANRKVPRTSYLNLIRHVINGGN